MNKTDVLIIGAGPTGLFCAHQLGIIGLTCEIVDNLDKAGGQCIELYPDKPIYDIPALPECTGEELTNNLLQQIKPFNVKFHLNERVEELKKVEDRWHVKTNGKKEFDVASIVIAGGVGSFEPRKFPVKESEKFEGSSIGARLQALSYAIIIFGFVISMQNWLITIDLRDYNSEKIAEVPSLSENETQRLIAHEKYPGWLWDSVEEKWVPEIDNSEIRSGD